MTLDEVGRVWVLHVQGCRVKEKQVVGISSNTNALCAVNEEAEPGAHIFFVHVPFDVNKSYGANSCPYRRNNVPTVILQFTPFRFLQATPAASLFALFLGYQH